ncbi:MAG TPA: helix-hairpin-helix domain-containing protein [Rhizomicrobium sp.]|nr:helix-hairpin-helix domain-containing protein [Rhizomicrobium sp.]
MVGRTIREFIAKGSGFGSPSTDMRRKTSGLARALQAVTVAASVLLAAGLSRAACAQTPDLELAALNAKASALDAQDYRFVQPVCTRCHSPEMFLHSRSWSGWQDIFNQMKGYGAAGSSEQWEHIYRYFQHSLTRIDVNHADEDELSAVLGVDEKTAIAIVQRRTDQRFKTAAELEAVPGVDRNRIEDIRPRLLFDPPAEDQ